MKQNETPEDYDATREELLQSERNFRNLFLAIERDTRLCRADILATALHAVLAITVEDLGRDATVELLRLKADKIAAIRARLQ